MANETLEHLAQERILILTTYRRTGVPVPTPIGFVREGDQFLIWTRAETGKVKRIRHTPAVTVAPGTPRGDVTGPALPAVASILPAEETPRVLARLKERYPTAFQEATGGVILAVTLR
jgi:PPOX class probable F420-dependent enzyme